MAILLAIGAVILACFSLVLLFGAPYLPTLRPQIAAALELAELKPGDTLLELGCGDGVVLVAAAKQGITVVGYELNPLLVLVCRIRTWRYRKLVTVIWGDFWRKPWPEAEAIFVFLLDKYMSKLDKKVMQYKPKPVNVISFAFQIPDKKPTATKQGLYKYTYL